MGFLRRIFGPSKNEIWAQFAREVGGSFDVGGFMGKDAVVARHGEWEIVLDTFTTRKKSPRKQPDVKTYTRFRAPFVNRDGLRLQVYQTHLFSGLGELLGCQDIEIGHEAIDKALVFKGNNEQRVRGIFRDAAVLAALKQVSKVHLEIRDDDGCFGSLHPDGVDMLYFRTVGVMRDLRQLHNAFDLMTVVLDKLNELDSP